MRREFEMARDLAEAAIARDVLVALMNEMNAMPHENRRAHVLKGAARLISEEAKSFAERLAKQVTKQAIDAKAILETDYAKATGP